MLIINSAYYENSEIDTPDDTHSFLVTSAGHHVLKSLMMFDTVRPTGRHDYQIIYVKQGQLYYQEQNEQRIAPAGSILLYQPFVPQFYTYYLEDSPDIYWMHFTGSNVADRLKELHLHEQLCHKLLSGDGLDELFNNIIHELQIKSPYYVEICTLICEQLLYKISRNAEELSKNTKTTYSEIEEIVHLFNTHYSDTFNICELAKKHNISTSWLTRLFKKHLNMSPQQYLTKVRIEKAKLLLSSTNSIKEIAFTVGYSDPLYFSRVFRKITGMSPSEYRNQSYSFSTIPLNKAPWMINNKHK